MTDQTIIDIGTRAIWVSLQVSAPVLIAALVAGVVISIFQAATQIQEQTLAFVPKVLVITGVMVVCAPWILHLMMDFTTDLWSSIPGVTH